MILLTDDLGMDFIDLVDFSIRFGQIIFDPLAHKIQGVVEERLMLFFTLNNFLLHIFVHPLHLVIFNVEVLQLGVRTKVLLIALLPYSLRGIRVLLHFQNFLKPLVLVTRKPFVFVS